LNSAAAGFNVSPKTAAKGVRRFQAEAAAGMADHSSRPHRLRCPTSLETVAQVEALRQPALGRMPHLPI